MTIEIIPRMEYDVTRGRYKLLEAFTYYSPRYRKHITVPVGLRSDGASGPAEDITSIAWWTHDRVCGVWMFDDGTGITTHMASTILYDILRSEGRWFRARSWWISTRLLGPRSPHG